jgi:hypothetical protein
MKTAQQLIAEAKPSREVTAREVQDRLLHGSRSSDRYP